MRPSADYWIQKLELTTHIEGGSYKEVYRSAIQIPVSQLSGNFKGDRNVSTSIYFLLEQGQFSAFHRITSDELWHFYFGDELIVYEITPGGTLREHVLGTDFEKGQRFQCHIQACSWFASRPSAGSEYALTGCTVAPGFDFADFELADRHELVQQFPQHASLITSLTR